MQLYRTEDPPNSGPDGSGGAGRTGDIGRLRFPQGRILLAAFIVGAVVAAYVQLTLVPITTHVFGLFDSQVDLRVYRQGAFLLRHGAPLYDGGIIYGLEYTYTPFSALVFQPFDVLPYPAAVAAWSVLIFAALYWVVVAGFRSLGYVIDWRIRVAAVCLVAAATLMEPVRTTIWLGQVNVFLMAIVLWDLSRPEGSRLKGFSVGLAAGIKLTPAFFFVYLAITRQWRALGTGCAAAVATVVLGFLCTPRQSWKYWTSAIFDPTRVGSANAFSNQSINGLIANALHTEHPSRLLWLPLCALAVAFGMTAAYLAHRQGEELLALSLTGMTMTTVSPFAWGHHWVWFVPLAVYLIHRALQAWNQRRGIELCVWMFAIAALYATVFIWRRYIPEGAFEWKPFYGTGLFMAATPRWLYWFTRVPYLWVFVVAATVTIAGWWFGRRKPLAA